MRAPAHAFGRGVRFGSSADFRQRGGGSSSAGLGGGISNRAGGAGFGSSGSGGGAEELGGGGSEVQVVNFPLAISSSEAGRSYHRNALLFNVGLVLHQVVRSRSMYAR